MLHDENRCLPLHLQRSQDLGQRLLATGTRGDEYTHKRRGAKTGRNRRRRALRRHRTLRRRLIASIQAVSQTFQDFLRLIGLGQILVSASRQGKLT